MPVRGVAPLITEPAHGSAFEVSMTPEPFLETPLALTPPYRDWRSPLLDADANVPMPHVYYDNLQIEEPSPYDNDRDYAKIHTPYSALNFQSFLEHTQLLSRYPELPFKLTHGFPIGNLAPLTHTFTPPNLPGASLHADTIRAYISEELRLGRFSGPFTREALELKIGNFRSSPLQVAVKEGMPGEPTKYRVCRHLSYKGKAQSSINDEINSNEYPTRWGKATDVAEIVRLSHLPLPAPALYLIHLVCSYHVPHCLLTRLTTHLIIFSYRALFSHSHHSYHFSILVISPSCNFYCFHDDNDLSPFSSPTMEVICVMRAYTRDSFEGHHCQD
jgi:hypothetical protein